MGGWVDGRVGLAGVGPSRRCRPTRGSASASAMAQEGGSRSRGGAGAHHTRARVCQHALQLAREGVGPQVIDLRSAKNRDVSAQRLIGFVERGAAGRMHAVRAQGVEGGEIRTAADLRQGAHALRRPRAFHIVGACG